MIKKFIAWLKKLLFGSFFSSDIRPEIKKGKPYKSTEQKRTEENKIRKHMFQVRLKRRARRKVVSQRTIKNQIDRKIYKRAHA